MALGTSLPLSGLSCLFSEMELVIPTSQCCHKNDMGSYRIKSPSPSLEHRMVSVQVCDPGCLRAHREPCARGGALLPSFQASFKVYMPLGGGRRSHWSLKASEAVQMFPPMLNWDDEAQHGEGRGLGMRGPAWLPKHTCLPRIICHSLPGPLSSLLF